MNFKSIKYFIQYYLDAQNLYTIHSPRIYTFIKNTFDVKKYYYDFSLIEQEREIFKVSQEEISIGVNGNAGSITRKLSDLVRQDRFCREKCRLLFNIVRFSKPSEILVLGTGLGFSSAYMAHAFPQANINTIECDKSLHSISNAMFDRLGISNIRSYNMNFDSFFSKINPSDNGYEMVFIDDDHNYDSILRSFDKVYSKGLKKQVIIINNLYRSTGRYNAWNAIKNKMNGSITIDIFKIGIILVDPEIEQVMNISYIPWKFKPWKLGIFAPGYKSI